MDYPVLHTQDTTVCNTYRQRWMSRVMLFLYDRYSWPSGIFDVRTSGANHGASRVGNPLQMRKGGSVANQTVAITFLTDR